MMGTNKRKSDEIGETSKYFKEAENESESKYGSSAAVEEYSYNKTQLNFADYNKPGLELARYLLGKIIVRIVNKNDILSARIVETEAYLGISDKACHSYGNKKTDRTKPMFMAAGTSYVYSIYGMYFCLNISSSDEGGCVLIRAAQPLQGIDSMMKNRSKKIKKQKLLTHHLCNGPSKLCQAMNITKASLNCIDLPTSNEFFLLNDDVTYEDDDVVVCRRIGIDGYGEEAAVLPYRFYVLGNKNVSSRDKKVESSFS